MPIVSAIDKLDGRASDRPAGSKASAANAKHDDDNEGIVAAVESGQVAAGVINHYYWFEQASRGRRHERAQQALLLRPRGSRRARRHLRRGSVEVGQDPELAQKFLAFLASEKASAR